MLGHLRAFPDCASMQDTVPVPKVTCMYSRAVLPVTESNILAGGDDKQAGIHCSLLTSSADQQAPTSCQ